MFDQQQNNFLEEQQIPWREYFSIIYRGRWWILAVFLLVSSIWSVYTIRMPAVYQAETTIEIKAVANKYQDNLNVFSSGDRVISNHMELIKSRAVAQMVLDAIDKSEEASHISLSRQQGKGLSYDSRINMLRSKISVFPIKNTDIVRVTIQDNNAFQSAFLANTLAREYVVYSSESNRGEIGSITDFLKVQLDQIKDKLKISEENLEGYKKQENLVSLPDETKLMIGEVSNYEAQHNTALASLEAQEKRVEFLTQKLGENEKRYVDYVTKNTSPIIKSYREKVTELYGRIAELEVSNKPGKESAIKDLQLKIDRLKEEIVVQAQNITTDGTSVDPTAINSDLMQQVLNSTAEQLSLKAKIASLRRIIDKYNFQMSNIPEQSLKLARLERDKRINEETFVMMQNKYEEYRVSQAGQVGNARIVDEAITPVAPIKPDKPLYLIIGLIVGLVLGVLFAFLLSFFDTSIKTIEDIEKLNAPFLGSIPTINLAELEKKMHTPGQNLTDSEQQKIQSKLVTHFSPKSPIAEAYRSIRTNVQFSKVDNPPKLFVVSSSVPKEGKSTTVANLAITISQSGCSVLIVDADLRRPVVHRNFGMLREIGLSDYLLHNRPIDEIVKKTDIENLSIITCGEIPHNPSELLGSHKMENFIREIREKFDYVIFDTPPIITVTDATVLSLKVDGLLLVVSSGQVGKAEILRSISVVKSVEANLIGVILNNLDIKRLYGSYYYYYHYYHYYYYYGTERRRRKKNKKRTGSGHDEG